jgi:hypothetical protein
VRCTRCVCVCVCVCVIFLHSLSHTHFIASQSNTSLDGGDDQTCCHYCKLPLLSQYYGCTECKYRVHEKCNIVFIVFALFLFISIFAGYSNAPPNCGKQENLVSLVKPGRKLLDDFFESECVCRRWGEYNEEYQPVRVVILSDGVLLCG